MADLPRLTAKEAERLLLQNGFTLARQKGSHKIYIKGKIRQVCLFILVKFYTPYKDLT